MSKQGKTANANPRDALFTKFYTEGGPDFGPGNAYQSCIAAGFERTTAKNSCHIIAARNRVSVAHALRSIGANEFYLARKITRLAQAKTVRWNPSKRGTAKKPKGGWDTFEDNTTQLGAARELGKFLDAYPAPKEPTGGDTQTPVQIIFPGSFANLMEAEQEKAGG